MSCIILSICIPTYNRATNLYQTIESIVNQETFKNGSEVEIVVSDNCSNDNTEEVVNKFIDLYGSKVRYFRNEENIKDANFELSLRRGDGKFLKLNNDTLVHTPESLKIMLDCINLNTSRKDIIYFLNKKSFIKVKSIKGLSGFLEAVSFHCTWIGSFGIWKQDLEKFHDFSRYSALQLTQVDVLFRMIGLNRNIVINDETLFIPVEVAKKGGYDLITVFLQNYSFILNEAKVNGLINERDYLNETKRVLLGFFAPWFAKSFVYPQKFYFGLQNKFVRINEFFKSRTLLLVIFYLKYGFHVIYYKTKMLRNI